MLAAVSQYGYALQYAAPSLRADKEILLAAVAHHGNALRDAAPSLRADKELVLIAMAHTGFALDYAAANLRADEELVLIAVAHRRKFQSSSGGPVSWWLPVAPITGNRGNLPVIGATYR